MGETLDAALARTAATLTPMHRGDPEPYIACWSNADDVTLFGAWGPMEQGATSVIDTYRWVASRFGPAGESSQELSAVHESGDLAVTVGFERGVSQVDGADAREMVIRVTHVYRRENGEWKLIHRHGDFAPADQRKT